MEWDVIAPMIVAVVFILTVGGVAVLRPLSRRLAELLEAMTRDTGRPRIEEELTRVRELLEVTTSRLELLEERQEFTERLLADKSRDRLPKTGD